ncbi:MAG: hypothetical protein ACXWP0_03670 [Ktedonobacterales bacterium]
MTPLDIRIIQDMVTVALLATPLMSFFIKPYISLLPIAKADAPTRNAVLTGVGVLLNLALLVGLLYAQDALDLHYWYAILSAALGQQAISHTAYQAGKISGGVSAPTARPQREYKGLPPFGSVAFQPPDPPVASGTPSPVEPTA